MMRIRFFQASSAVAILAAAVLAPAASSQADVAMPNPPEFPDSNPLLPDQDLLGKFLFWEEQMSHDNTVSCGTCHIHEAGGSDPRATATINPGADNVFGTDDDIRGSAGVHRIDHATNQLVFSGSFGTDVQVTGRKSPSMINAVYFEDIFWDGRATQAYTDPQTGLVELPYLGALESQAAGPPVSDVEMGSVGRTWDHITAKLVTAKPGALATDLPPEMEDFRAAYPTYPAMFAAVYGDPAITSKRITFAIANYERTLIADESPLDDFLKGNTPDMGPFQAGFTLFGGAANCTSCHTLPFTMDSDYHNIGVRPESEDIGRMGFTGNPADIGKFKTPMVRNAALRVPLFHNGQANTVADVVEFYDRGGDFNVGNQDPQIVPLGLTAQQKADLVALIEDGMTDPRLANNVFPFTRPTLRSELPPLNVEYGVASLDSQGGTAGIYANGPANRGNANFVIGLRDARPNKPATLVFSFGADPNGTLFPDPRFPVPVNLGIGAIFLKAPTATTADGLASFNLGIPNDSILAGFEFYAQWFIADPGSNPPGGIYGTKGLAVTIL